jgi:hypothetical protein
MQAKKGSLWLFVIEQAVAVPVVRDLVFMVDARAFDSTVALLVTAPQATGTVGPPELILVPDKPPDHNFQVVFIGIEFPPVLAGDPVRPFEHVRFSLGILCHDDPSNLGVTSIFL